jgi:penicillin-binding protein activator
MKLSRILGTIFCLSAVLGFLTSCGPKAFTKGDYDKNVEAENTLDDQWSETDMQKIVQKLVGNLTNHRSVAASKRPPVIMVTQLQNKTSEHIDTQSVMDMVRVELTNSGRVAFVDKEAREDVSAEYEYQEGNMDEASKKTKGGQTGADYILNGRLDSITKEVGNDKTVYYKVTLNLTNLKTNLVEWTGQDQLRKLFKKKRIGI